MLTIIGDLTYTSDSSSIAETTFNNLTGVTSITATQAGGYQFQALTSASNIRLFDNYESTVTVIHFGALTTVDNFYTDDTEDIIEFSKATELHLTSLGRYSTTSSKPLKLIIDEGGALPLAIDDVATDGDQEDLYLEITGPDAITFDNISDGQLTFTDVKAVTVNGFVGTIVTNDGVESLTADTVVNAPTLGSDLETINLTGVADADDSDDTHGPSITIDNQDNLETITLAGKLGAITLSDNDNLTDVTISADVDGAITIGVDTDDNAANNSDLVNVTLTGSKATGVTISNNAEIETLTIDTTMQAGTASDAVLDGSVVVQNNAALTSLTISSSSLETLTITGNDDLTTIDGTGIIAIGATGEPTVTIEDNDLTATASVDAEDTTATADGAASTDLGSITTDSGMDTFKTYLALVAADADSTAEVYFDTVESYTDESDDEDTDQTWVDGNVPTANKVLVLTPADVTAGGSSIAAKRAFVISGIADGDALQIMGGAGNLNYNILDGGEAYPDLASGDYDSGATEHAAGVISSSVAGMLILKANTSLDVDRIKNTAHLTRATAIDVTLDAIAGGKTTLAVSFAGLKSTAGYASTATAATGERYQTETAVETAAASFSTGGLGEDDIFTLTITHGSATNVVTAAGASAYSSTTQALKDALASAYDVKYAPGTGTKSNAALASVASNAIANLVFTALNEGSDAADMTISLSITASATGDTSTTGANFDWVIGDTRASSDNTFDSDNIIVYLTSNDAGVALDKVAAARLTAAAVAAGTTPTITELTSTYYTNALARSAAGVTEAVDYALQQEERTDVANPEEGFAAVTNTAAVNFSRVHWL
jgi:hypothetical protein